MKTLFAFVLLAGTAHAELLGWIAWDNPQPIVGAAEYRLWSWPVHIPVSPPPGITELGATWKSPGSATLSDPGLFEEWWTNGDSRYTVIGLTSGDQSDVRPGSRTGLGLDAILNSDGGAYNEYLAAGGWSGERLVPQLGGIDTAFIGYDITHLERIVTPTSQRIEIYGAAIAVPEPSTLLLLLVATCILFASNRYWLVSISRSREGVGYGQGTNR